MYTGDCAKTWQVQTVKGCKIVNDFHFLNSDTGFAATNNSLWWTIDGGTSWSQFDTLQVKGQINGIHFSKNGVGAAVGNNGMVWITYDNGTTWPVNTVLPKGNNLKGIFVLDKSTLFVGGSSGIILNSTDGGKTWREGTKLQNSEISKIFFLDSHKGFASGTSLWVSKNGGSSWTTHSLLSDANFSASYFFNASSGVLGLSDGSIWATKDSGITWTKSQTGIGQIQRIQFVDSAYGWAVGSINSSVARTRNGGKTWETVKMPVTGNYFDVCFVNRRTGIITGMYVFRTDDGGDTWKLVYDSQVEYIVHSGYMIDSAHVIIGGSYGLIGVSDDACVTWDTQKVRIGSWETTHNDIRFVDSLHGWIATGGRYSVDDWFGAVHRTCDGGKTWTGGVIHDGSLRELSVTDPAHLWVCGEHAIMSSSDSGKTWRYEYLEYNPSELYISVWMCDTNYGWLCGMPSELMRTPLRSLVVDHYTHIENQNSFKCIENNGVQKWREYPGSYLLNGRLAPKSSGASLIKINQPFGNKVSPVIIDIKKSG